MVLLEEGHLDLFLPHCICPSPCMLVVFLKETAVVALVSVVESMNVV